MEGLRVNPAHQGRGFATHLHHHLVRLALEQPGIRSLGLATSWKNEKVFHLARASGMRQQGDYRYLRAPAHPDSLSAIAPEQSLSPAALLARLRAGPWLRQTGGYLMAGWVAQQVDEPWLAERLAEGSVWRFGEALALIGRSEGSVWLYGLDGGSEAEQEALARHARHLAWRPDAAPQDFPSLRCFAPPDPALLRPLLAAGLGDPWPDEQFHILHFARDLTDR